MDRATALEYLGLADQDWGPCFAEEFTHEEFAAKWRGEAPCPTEAEIEAVKIGG